MNINRYFHRPQSDIWVRLTGNWVRASTLPLTQLISTWSERLSRILVKASSQLELSPQPIEFWALLAVRSVDPAPLALLALVEVREAESLMLGLAAETSNSHDAVAEFKEGVKHLKNNYPQKALPKLQSAFESDRRNPYYVSFLGVAIARARQNWTQATELCEKAVQCNPKEIQFHLNLAEVYALAGQREVSLYKLDCAIELLGDDRRLKRARSKVEKRRTPVLPFFGRGHFLNRELGKLRHRILQRFDT